MVFIQSNKILRVTIKRNQFSNSVTHPPTPLQLQVNSPFSRCKSVNDFGRVFDQFIGASGDMIQKQYETASQCTHRRAYYKRAPAVMSSRVAAACSVSRCHSTASPRCPSTAQLCRSVIGDWREFTLQSSRGAL